MRHQPHRDCGSCQHTRASPLSSCLTLSLHLSFPPFLDFQPIMHNLSLYLSLSQSNSSSLHFIEVNIFKGHRLCGGIWPIRSYGRLELMSVIAFSSCHNEARQASRELRIEYTHTHTCTLGFHVLWGHNYFYTIQTV